jgi:biotin carboxylase
MDRTYVFLCIACEFKGGAFLRQLKRLGHIVYLVTSEKTRNDAWPYDDLEDVFYMPEKDGRKWDINQLIAGVAYLFRSRKIDRIIALDDYDVWKAARLREEFRIPGMGETTARHFFDKLAMRIEARDAGLPVPGFTGLFNDDTIRDFLSSSTGPWLAKPRRDAGSLGIRKIMDADAFWKWAAESGEHRHEYLLEEFRPGIICHVDSLNYEDETLFTRCSQYLDAPFDVAHGGGIFQSKTMGLKESLSKKLVDVNKKVLAAFGLKHGASHSEYIVRDGGKEILFLETSARCGGAHLTDMVEAATGISLWTEWANIEHSVLTGKKYHLPMVDELQAGIIVTLSRFEKPDYENFTDEEIWWKLHKKYHIGFIFQHKTAKRIEELLAKYAELIRNEYSAAVPLKE